MNEQTQQTAEIIALWKCASCDREIKFYAENEFIDSLHLAWAEHTKICRSCKKKQEYEPIIVKGEE